MLTIGEMRKMMAYDNLPLFAISQASCLLQQISKADCAPPASIRMHAEVPVKNCGCTYQIVPITNESGHSCYAAEVFPLHYVNLIGNLSGSRP